jgi:hypothetical protein
MIGSPITFNGFTINNHAGQPLLQAQAPFYYIAVTNVDGLYTSDISYESHPLPNITGEKSGDVFRRGKTITLSGNITGHNFSYLLNGVDYLYNMFASTTIHELGWTRQNDSMAVYINCRVQQDLSVVESIGSLLPRFAWVIGLRADNPRSYKQSDDTLYPSWQ